MLRIQNVAVMLCVAAALALANNAVPAAANGYWNLPSTCCQCWGVGFGAGYHANYVLGPITCQEMFDHKEVRLRHAPSPPCANQCSSYGGYGYHPQSQLEGSVVAPAAHAHAPMMMPTAVEPTPAANVGEAMPPMPMQSAPAEQLPPPLDLQPSPIELPTLPESTPPSSSSEPAPSTQPIFGAPVE